MAKTQARAPGGGRKPLNPDVAQSAKVMVRIEPALRKELLSLAEKHRVKDRPKNLSREIKNALWHWVKRHEIPQLHNSALATAISLLADRIERLTGQSWMDHPLTREVVREHVERLVAHILSPLGKPVTVPQEIKEDAGILLTLLIHAIPRPGSRRLEGTVIVDDPGLAMLVNDLARHLGSEPANVETRPALVARREQREKERK